MGGSVELRSKVGSTVTVYVKLMFAGPFARATRQRIRRVLRAPTDPSNWLPVDAALHLVPSIISFPINGARFPSKSHQLISSLNSQHSTRLDGGLGAE